MCRVTWSSGKFLAVHHRGCSTECGSWLQAEALNRGMLRMALFIIKIGEDVHPATFNRSSRAQREAKRLFRDSDAAHYDLDLSWQTRRDGSLHLVAAQPYAYDAAGPWLTGYVVTPKGGDA